MKTIIFISSILILTVLKSVAQNVQIVSKQGNWELLVDNQPFFIKGVVGHTYLEKVKE